MKRLRLTENTVPFTPFLATAIVVAVFRRAQSDAPLVSILEAPAVLAAWFTIGVMAPAMLLASWLMITHMSGRWRYSGYCIRLGADLALAFILSAFDFQHHYQNHPTALATRLGIIAFVLALVVRDVWQLVNIERERIEREQVC